MKTHIPQEQKERFLKFVHPDQNTGCWLWSGAKFKSGYGKFNVSINGFKKTWRAHRFSWLVHDKELIEGMDLCHSCDNRMCVNPNHLWLGTRKQNLLDCKNKNRNPVWNKTHCKYGHEFTKENIFLRPDGFRECLTCSNRRKKTYYLKMKDKPEFREKNARKARERRSNKSC